MVNSHKNRREFLRALMAAPAGLTLTLPALAQSQPALEAKKLADDLAVVTGDGGNIAVAMADDGLFVVDAGLAGRAADLLKFIAEDVSPHKVVTLFNTHWHLDHVGANEMLGKAGARIVAHENVKKRLSEKITMEALNRTIEPLKPEGLPTETFPKGGKVKFGRERIEYMSVPPAHTDGDSYVFLPGPNVLHTGDLLFNGFYPFIDYSTGGWIGGMAAASEKLLKVGDGKTRIIPGHGPLGSKDDLKASRDMLSGVYAKLEPLAKQGKPVEEAIAAAPTKEYDEKWGKGYLKPDQFVRLAYTSILRHNEKG